MAETCIWNDERALFGAVELNEIAEAFFPDMGLEDALYPSLKQYLEEKKTILELLELIYVFFKQIPDDVFQALPCTRAEYIEKIKQVSEEINFKRGIYTKENKPNPDGVYWPRENSFLEETIEPFAKKYPIMDMNTLLGAAGSCFASEFSFAMQSNKFNYLIKEPLHTGEHGIFNSSTRNNPNMPDSSAQWGTLFNTPSFTHLAERAFGDRSFPKILVSETNKNGLTQYNDPYREGVFFQSQEIFEDDYELHLKAVREVFEECEVFVFTPGLSECWEYMPHGSVMSRNPRNETLRSLSRPRVLTYEDNVHYMQRFIDIVRHHNPKIKFIISVSPIPFLATTRGHEMHVMEANVLSKAAIRLAVDHVCRNNQDVFYFPSYELVTTVLPKPWEEDMRHVTKETVGKVVGLFEKMFVRH
ncbi:GSCFA domain-containing protein [Curvivirga sp.]|uniref:GSCFA domain-containing protein n=1 Tax=Curvivirga sp. TaxID=2856848 RepID=UPI003B5B6668